MTSSKRSPREHRRTPKPKPVARAAPAPAPSREERKLQTRHALMDAALELVADSSFSSLSLREVARAAGVVPTAFYRHFESMDALGLALVDDSFRTLRQMIRDARAEPSRYEHVIRWSVEILVRHVHEHRMHFRFIVRERYGGRGVVRTAIRNEIRLFTSELATDLARFPFLGEWTTEDLQMMADLLVGAMVSIAESIVDAPAMSAEAEAEIVRKAEKQLRLVSLGVPGWRSGG